MILLAIDFHIVIKLKTQTANNSLKLDFLLITSIKAIVFENHRCSKSHFFKTNCY